MPARFRFRLEKVLELRKWEEKQAELAFAAKTGECALLENKIQALMVEKHNSFRQRSFSSQEITTFLAYEVYSARLGREIVENEKVLARKIVERDELQAIFLEKQKIRKAIEKLEEKKREEFKKQQQKLDQVRTDDLNTAAYLRKMTAVEGISG